MPPKRKTGKKTKRPARKATMLVNKALHPVPQRFITKQKYSQTFTLNTLVNSYIFNLNSVFDPDRSGVGHQPYGYDTLATLYNRYRVIGCSWVINGYCPSTAVRIGCIAANDQPTLVSMSDLIERPRARFIVQNPGGDTNYLKGSISIASLVGRSKSQYMSDDRYQADVGSSPVELALLQVLGKNLSDVTEDINLTVTLEYTVEYFDAKQLAQS